MARFSIILGGFLSTAAVAVLSVGSAAAAPGDGGATGSTASTTSTTAAAPSTPSPAAKPNAAAAPNAVTVVFQTHCTDYGFDVTNNTAVVHTIVLTVGPTAQPDVPVAAGATVHIALAESTPPASQVTLTDTTNPANPTVLFDRVVRFCVNIVNRSVTIQSGTSYTLNDGFISIAIMDPRPTHGTVGLTDSTGIRYTPDPCFAGTDRFGYNDFIQSVQGVVTVTVLPGPCRVTVSRTATDCAARTVAYTATNPYTVPVTVQEAGPNGSSDVREFVVPARTTKVIHQLTFDPSHPTSERLTFRLVDPLVTLFADTVLFPCPAGAGDSQVPLAATGSAVAGRAGWGAGAVAVGVLLTWLGRRRTRGAHTR